jgi:hypothetical protein
MSILIPVGYEVSNKKSTSFKGIDLYKVTGVLYLRFPEFKYTVNGESIFLEDSVGAYIKIKNKYLGIDSSNTPIIFTYNKDSYIGEKDLSSYYFKSVSKSGKTFYESKHTGFSIDIDNTVLLNIDLANHAYSITPITSVTDFVTVECCDSDENSFSVKSLYDIMETIDTGVYKLDSLYCIENKTFNEVIVPKDCKCLFMLTFSDDIDTLVLSSTLDRVYINPHIDFGLKKLYVPRDVKLSALLDVVHEYMEYEYRYAWHKDIDLGFLREARSECRFTEYWDYIHSSSIEESIEDILNDLEVIVY